MEGVARYRQHLYARMPIYVVDRHFSQQRYSNRSAKGKVLDFRKEQAWTSYKRYLLFFKIKVWRVKFNGGAKNGDGALLVLVAERLVFREALRHPWNLLPKISNIPIGMNKPCKKKELNLHFSTNMNSFSAIVLYSLRDSLLFINGNLD